MIDRLSNYETKLFANPKGRYTTGTFNFYLNGNDIRINKAQIEVDGQYENDKEILLFEAKLRATSLFNIRQLYYPFRDHIGKKKVRVFFFHRRYKQPDFQILGYAFDPPPNHFDAIKFVNFYNFKLKLKKKFKT